LAVPVTAARDRSPPGQQIALVWRISNDLEGVRSFGAVGCDRDFVLPPFSIDRIAETEYMVEKDSIRFLGNLASALAREISMLTA
jgi:hypothetical protein